MKKLFPLFILIILVSFLPFVKAETESLYVDSKTTDLQNWDQRNAPSPYLADESIGYIRETKSSAATEGYFGFADPSGTGTINNVYLYMECYGDDTNDQIWIFVDCSDGGGWVNEGTIYVNQLSYDWEILFLSTRLDSWPDIQNAQIYLFYQGVGGGDDIYVRRAFLYVDYTPAGMEYTRELSQSLFWTGDSYRTCNLKRVSSQGLTLASDSLRKWDGHIALTLGTTLATTTSRDINYLRTFTQSISISLNVFAKQFEYFLRTLNLGLSLTLDSSRTSGLSRLINQGITLSNLASRNIVIFRSLTQGLSFLSSAIGQITTGGEQFLRMLTMSMSLTLDSICQKLLGGLTKRLVTLSLNFASNIAVYTTIINEFNAPLIMLILTSIVFTVVYIIKDGTIWVGFTSGTCWAATAFIIFFENVNYWPYALFFGALSVVLYWLTVVEIIELKEVPWM